MRVLVGDLAALECAVLDVFDGPDAEPVRSDALVGIEAKQWVSLEGPPATGISASGDPFLETRGPCVRCSSSSTAISVGSGSRRRLSR